MSLPRAAAPGTRRHSLLSLSVQRLVLPLLVLCTGGAGAFAQQETPGVFKNPPLLEIERRAAPSTAPAVLAAETPLRPGEAVFDLTVDYIDGEIWNPAERRKDNVKLRGYRGQHLDPKAPYVAPTIQVHPGETVRMTLNNRLPVDPDCRYWTEGVNKPHCFNGTNMHTHGLWVNPSGNGDNLLISINPGVSFEYEYNIPLDHPVQICLGDLLTGQSR